MKENSKIRKIAFVGDHLPRRLSEDSLASQSRELSLAEMQLAQNILTSFKEPIVIVE